MIKYKLLMDFRSPSSTDCWEIIGDPVMGGRSETRLMITPQKTAVFEGTVSFENEGGFASIRSRPADFFLDGLRGLVIRVRGDGKEYRLRILTSAIREGAAYQVSFRTEPDIWISPYFPFSDFRPFHRGTPLNLPPLDPAEIRQIGFMIADRQEGPFRLEIEWVKAYLDY
jgi:NADH dehydrogenase [ubiquinone] 1 alpha subcomplex assembly factor 1